MSQNNIQPRSLGYVNQGWINQGLVTFLLSRSGVVPLKLCSGDVENLTSQLHIVPRGMWALSLWRYSLFLMDSCVGDC